MGRAPSCRSTTSMSSPIFCSCKKRTRLVSRLGWSRFWRFLSALRPKRMFSSKSRLMLIPSDDRRGLMRWRQPSRKRLLAIKDTRNSRLNSKSLMLLQSPRKWSLRWLWTQRRTARDSKTSRGWQHLRLKWNKRRINFCKKPRVRQGRNHLSPETLSLRKPRRELKQCSKGWILQTSNSQQLKL